MASSRVLYNESRPILPTQQLPGSALRMFRYLGINTHRESDMIFASERRDTFDVALVDFNVLQLDRILVIEWLHAAGIGVMAGTVFCQGHLFERKIGSFRSAADV